jgi:LysM repeat protein
MRKSRGAPAVAASVLVLAALLIAACGQVVTVAPTPAPSPTPTINVALVAATVPPTATPAPVTPAPTATPTITPTPVTHVVAAGESLLALADRYGVSVPLLQEANGILDPRTLQVGQELIIPNEEPEEVAAALTPTPTPMPVVVENLHLIETGAGGLWVLGEIRNTTPALLEQVRGGITLLDGSGAILLTETGLSALDLVKPGESAPFAILVEEAPADFESYAAFAASAVPGYAGSYYRDLEVREVSGHPAGSASYAVSGAVFNVGPEEAMAVEVILTAYDQESRVIAVRQITPPNSIIPPAGNVPFETLLTPLGGPVARVEAVAQARRMSVVQDEP